MPAQNWLLRTGFSLLFASGCIVTEPDITYVVPIRDASLTLGRDGAGGSRSSTVDGSGGLAGGWGGGGGSMEPGGAGGIGMGGIGGMGMGGAGTGGGKSGAGGAGGAADAGRDANGASGDADLGVDARIDAGAPGDAGTGGTGSDADGRTGTGGAGGSTGGAGGSTGGSGGSTGGSGGSSGGSGGSSGGSGGSSGGTGGTGASGKGGASVDGGGPDAPADGASGTITEFTIPTPNAGAYDIARGGDGNLWFTEETGNKVGRITTGGAITEYSLPTANARPRGLTAAGTRIYFTEFGANKIGYLETSNPSVITEVPCLAGPTGMMKADDGAVWYTAVGANEIAKLAADGTTAGHWLASAGVGGPILFTYSQVWFATTTQTRVGTFNPLNNTIQSPLGGGDAGAESLVDIIVDWNDEIWFIDGTRSNSYPSSVTFTAPGTMRSVALGPTPQLLNQYITMPSANMILVKATNNTFKTYGVPTANSTPHDIVDAPDKNVWFTEKTGNKIGRMVP